mmetsp:Transcript_74542/g.230368  ORF Transcript_74542/g.230368 Transcript_74542/m.230368 type:complete len:377 (+) Transcript_74542:89-1219(+)
MMPLPATSAVLLLGLSVLVHGDVVDRSCSDSSCSAEGPRSSLLLQQVTKTSPSEVAEVGADSQGYNMCFGSYTVGGYVCEAPAGEPDTKVYFPCKQFQKGAFPLVAFAHGSSGRAQIDQAGDSFKQVVSLGMIIIVPYTGGSPGCSSSNEYRDILRAVDVSEKNPGLHKALSRVDWSRQAYWGYSMGGKTIPRAVYALRDDKRVKAMVASYGARECNRISVPSMMLSGTRDRKSTPSAKMREEFDAAKSDYKVHLDYEGGGHTEPLDKDLKRPNGWVAKFLACHFGMNVSKTCGPIYGSKRSICKARHYSSNGCIVKGRYSKGKLVPGGDCTPEGADPWAKGKFLDCCSPSKSCLGKFGRRWHFKCLAKCPSRRNY